MQANNPQPQGQNNGTQNNAQKPSLSWSQPVGTTQNKNGQSSMKTSTPASTPTQQNSQKQSGNGATKTTPSMSNGNTKYIRWILAGLVAGLLVAWGWNATHKTPAEEASVATSGDTTSDTATNTSNGVTTPVASNSDMSGAGGSATVASPQTAGQQVSLSAISVSVPTWFVVYESNNGQPGNALGAGLFFPGHTVGTVELIRGTTAGQNYLLGQSLDDGDKVFSLQNDKPVRDAQGNPVMTPFTTN